MELRPVTKPAERIILGIDPGTTVMGYGLILVSEGKTLTLLQYGVLHLSKYSGHALKLMKIFEKVSQLITEYLPDELAIEAQFYGENVQSMLKLGRAQGVAIAAALSKQIPYTEYAPTKIKMSVTGNGRASKEQVAAMLCQLLKFDRGSALLDSTDALGVAVCHHFQTSGLGAIKTKSVGGGWAGFVAANKDRIK